MTVTGVFPFQPRLMTLRHTVSLGLFSLRQVSATLTAKNLFRVLPNLEPTTTANSKTRLGVLDVERKERNKRPQCKTTQIQRKVNAVTNGRTFGTNVQRHTFLRNPNLLLTKSRLCY
eukprot:4738377-Amphidinium_carterae.1